ncbi:hypothetical protein ASE63_24940 [Bosea sp. Root381]|uniref:hypothetical protein n=1 Tax=Bosea sp. Root381 TaxID=1736524 RepID=UPI000714951B|nr:hypothetical protein [Bosea sp. Root381]KRE05016.1 hypothetical protein ASE63_24940 [Bosea sp. Root381]
MLKEGKAIVRCQSDYDLAGERVVELGMPPSGSDAEAELFYLLEAMEKWDARHEDDDPEGWA